MAEVDVKLDKVAVKADYSCPHYRRNCEFYAPCCNKFYRCRFCHDDKEGHKFDRRSVNKIQCSHCCTLQDLQQNCANCGICFGKYFCAPCKLFDNADDKPQFHCKGCGICRIGPAKEFFHCQTCNMCLPVGLRDNHKCIKDVSRGDCPICLEDIHTSGEPSQIPPCHHLIHKSCYRKLILNRIYACPICSRSFGPLLELWKMYDDQIRSCPLPSDYRDLFVSALCRDCRSNDNVPFHFLGLKCGQCGSYNTVRNKGPYLKRSGEKWVVFDPAQDDGPDNATSQSSSDPWGGAEGGANEDSDPSWTTETNPVNEDDVGEVPAYPTTSEDCDNQRGDPVRSSKSQTAAVDRQRSQPEE